MLCGVRPSDGELTIRPWNDFLRYLAMSAVEVEVSAAGGDLERDVHPAPHAGRQSARV